MRNTPPLVPETFSYDTTVYIVLDDFGTLGRAYAETDEGQADEAVVIRDIIDGQYSKPLRVVAFNTHQGWSRDVTEEVAQKILDLNREGTALGNAATEFVERITGESPIVTV